MNNKTIILICCIFYINFAYSQMLPNNNLFHFPDNKGNNYLLNTQYISQSNSFSYPFIHNLIQNKYITNQIKDYNPYKNKILAQYEWLNEAHYYHQPDSLFGSDNTGIHLSTSYKQWFSLMTNKDLIKMILYGNKLYAGKKINFNSSKFYYLNFYSLTFGLFKNYWYSSFLLKAIFDINFHVFKEVQYLNIPQGSIFTAEDGTYIDVFLNGLYQASKQYNPGLSFNMGLKWNHLEKQTCISFQIYQLGFTRLNTNSQYARIDTTIRFEGIEIQNILNQQTFQSGLLNNDSLVNYYKSFIDTNFSYLKLPEIMRASFSKKWKHKIFKESFAAITFVFHTEQSIPELCLSQTLALRSNLDINTGTILFGFSTFNPFISICYRNSNKWEIQLFYSNPLSYINKKYHYNNSLQLFFKKAF